MLPTRPRLAARSTSRSCATPEPMIATRVSCGVTLMRISSFTHRPQPFQQLRCLVQRQPHRARVAAANLDDEARSAALDRVRARLVVGFPGRHVSPDFLLAELLELDLGARQRGFDALTVPERDRSEHLVAAPRERSE